ncbi:MAG: SDR family NAD(P)-dependent oxidoreductase [Alphaproteobacteria bacterium]|nr:SDR family NAD(P)-dependent oxidoreductase [Alphaproteobacteria bacterium]
MPVAVITGSTRGISLGLAREFLKRGHSVVVSGRSQSAVDAALASLSGDVSGEARATGQPCDVGDLAQVQTLWDKAIAEFGHVDYWINNAGLIHSYTNITELPPEDFPRIIQTNLTGVIHGTQVATVGMGAQDDGGWIYNMEGFGSDGMTRPGLTLYGTTKRAITYFTASAIKEAKGTNVKIGFHNPGIVMTDLGMGDTKELPKEERRKKKFLMLIGDTVEDVTTFLVSRVLSNSKHGKRIAWMTPLKLLGRVLVSPFHKRDPMTPGGY